MANTIRTKAQLLALFADNMTGDITPQNVRDFVVSNQALETQTADAPGVVVAEFTDFFIAGPGSINASLSAASGYGERSLTIANASGAEFMLSAAVGDTIDGGPSIIIDDQQFSLIGPNPAVANDWLVLILTSAALESFLELVDTPANYTGAANYLVHVNAAANGLEFRPPAKHIYQVMCSRRVAIQSDDLYFVHSQTINGPGYCIPRDGAIVTCSINRIGVAAADIEILINGLVELELSTSAEQTVHDPINVQVAAGDELRVRNKAGSNNMSNAVVSLLLEID